MRKRLTALAFVALLSPLSLFAASYLDVRVTFQTKRGQRPQPTETVVWLQPDNPARVPRPKAADRVILTTRSKMLMPHILTIPIGTTVQFPNEDPISHNLFSLSSGNGFDLGLYRRGAGKEHTFNTPGIVNVYCNVHPNMSAVIHVFDTPYYALTDAAGMARFTGVVPGRYTLIAWNEQVGSAESAVDIGADGSVKGSTALVIDGRASRPVAPHLNKYGKPYEASDDY